MTEVNINIVLIDLSRELELNDNDNTRIEIIVREALAKCGTLKAGEISECEDGNTSTYKDIMRFIRVQDRFIAFNSMLLKSYFYHEVIPEHQTNLMGGNATCYPIVSLPRTKAGKPYIPHQFPSFAFNVSHQFPFVGMVYNSQDNYGCILGLDIVTFEKINEALFPTITDFLDVYKGSFTKWEWDRIQNHIENSKESQNFITCCMRDTKVSRSDDSKLWEFYLRWSMKEAYTKALGKGMGIDFSSFRIQLSDVDSSNQSSGIWDYVVNHHQDNSTKNGSSEENEPLLVKTSATIHHNTGNPEFYDFVFVPLSSSGSLQNIITATFEIERTSQKFEFDGCACICVKSDNTAMFRQDKHCLNIKYKSMAMQNLQNFHQLGKGI